MEAAFILREARIILEQNLNDRIVTCKHYAYHSCTKVVTGRKTDIEKLAYQFPRVTREALIRQQVQNSLETGNFSVAVAEARNFTDVVEVLKINLRTKIGILFMILVMVQTNPYLSYSSRAAEKLK